MEKADAAVESDRVKILADIRESCGEYIHLNKRIMGGIAGAFAGTLLGISSNIVCNAACGDETALESIMSDPKSILSVCVYGFTGLLQKMIECGKFDVNVRDEKYDQSCIGWSAYGGHIQIARILIDQNVNIDKSRFGRTALMAAAMQGHHHYLQIILEYIERAGSIEIVDAADDNNQTALMDACVGGHAKCVKLLLNAGASPDKADIRGSTALMKAVHGGFISCVEKLLEAGANSGLRDHNGITALTKMMGEHAKVEDYQRCLQLIKEYDDSTTSVADVVVAVSQMKQNRQYTFEDPLTVADSEEKRHSLKLKKRVSLLRDSINDRVLLLQLMNDPSVNDGITKVQAKVRGDQGRKRAFKFRNALKYTSADSRYSNRGAFYRIFSDKKFTATQSTASLQ